MSQTSCRNVANWNFSSKKFLHGRFRFFFIFFFFLPSFLPVFVWQVAILTKEADCIFILLNIMDNRRVYKSYKEKLINHDNGFKPYSLITGKLKSLFQLKKSSPSKDENASSSRTPETKDIESTETLPQFIKPFKFPEPKLSEPLPNSTHQSFKLPGSFTITSPELKKQQDHIHQYEPSATKLPSRSNLVRSAGDDEDDVSINDNDTTANEVLSNFFKRKGDKPLNEIEYEGVMALISKSRSGTPIRKRIVSESIFDQPQRKKVKNDVLEHEGTNKQKTLIHDASNISFNTSEYKPYYLTVHNDTFDRSQNQSYNNTTSMIPSIKRVYQFSGLPSPYSTRIKPPTSSRKPKRTGSDVNKATTATIGDSTINNLVVNKSHEFKSETSKLLLSILDGKDGPEVPEPNEDNLQKGAFKFVNPYSKNGRRVVSRSKKFPNVNNNDAKPNKSISITASDIEKTISYDKSEKLPEVPKNSSIEKQLDKKQVANTEGNGSSKDHSTTTEINNDTIKKPVPTTTSSSFSFKPSTNGTLFSGKPSTESVSKTEEPKKSTFSFSNNTITSKIPTIPESGSNKKVNTSVHEFSHEFIFPNVDVKKVAIDSSKVDELKYLFQF